MKHSVVTKVVGLVSCLLVGFVLQASGAASLPMVDDFDDYADTQAVTNGTDWSYVSEEGSISLLPSGGLSGKGLQVTNATLTLDVNEAGNYTNVYVRVYAQATASESAPTVSDACAAFYIGSDSNIYARNSSTWSNLTSVASVGGWMGFVVHLDYNAGEYVVYADTGGTYGGVMTKLGGAPLTMENNSNKLYEIIVDCGKKTVVDGVGVSRGYTAAADSLANVDVIELTAAQYALVAFNELIYSAADNTLEVDKRLSKELKGALRVNDQVRTFNTNDWNTYLLQSSMEFNPQGSSMDLDAVHFTPEVSMWVYRAATLEPSLAFRTYETLITEEANPGTDLVGTTDGGVSEGWNQCGWTGGADGVNDGDNIGFQGNASNGDYLYLYRTGAWRRMWWDGADWRYGRNVASYSIVPNEGFWFLRLQATGFTWDPQ